MDFIAREVFALRIVWHVAETFLSEYDALQSKPTRKGWRACTEAFLEAIRNHTKGIFGDYSMKITLNGGPLTAPAQGYTFVSRQNREGRTRTKNYNSNYKQQPAASGQHPAATQPLAVLAQNSPSLGWQTAACFALICTMDKLLDVMSERSSLGW